MAIDLDAALASVAIVGATAFLMRRFFGGKPHAPACAPDGKAQPQVIVGAKLAKAMAGNRQQK